MMARDFKPGPLLAIAGTIACDRRTFLAWAAARACKRLEVEAKPSEQRAPGRLRALDGCVGARAKALHKRGGRRVWFCLRLRSLG